MQLFKNPHDFSQLGWQINWLNVSSFYYNDFGQDVLMNPFSLSTDELFALANGS